MISEKIINDETKYVKDALGSQRFQQPQFT